MTVLKFGTELEYTFSALHYPLSYKKNHSKNFKPNKERKKERIISKETRACSRRALNRVFTVLFLRKNYYLETIKNRKFQKK